MTIKEIDQLCRVIRDTTCSDRVRSAMVVAVDMLYDDMPISTIRWIVPMLRDMAVLSESFSSTWDDRCSEAISRAADALCAHITKETDYDDSRD
jgi:hypothetical protein